MSYAGPLGEPKVDLKENFDSGLCCVVLNCQQLFKTIQECKIAPMSQFWTWAGMTITIFFSFGILPHKQDFSDIH